jgi:hypothetical protein
MGGHGGSDMGGDSWGSFGGSSQGSNGSGGSGGSKFKRLLWLLLFVAALLLVIKIS